MAESATLSNHLVSICNRALEQRLADDPDFIDSYRTYKEQLKDLRTFCILKDEIRVLKEELESAKIERQIDEKNIEALNSRLKEIAQENFQLHRRTLSAEEEQCNLENRVRIVKAFINYLEEDLE